MGKSSLMVRTAARLRAEGVQVAVLDLTAIGQNLTPEQWYEGLLGRLGRQLDLEDELEAFWEEHAGLGPLRRWMAALEEVVLPRVASSATEQGDAQQLECGRQSASLEKDADWRPHSNRSTERLVVFVDEIDAVHSLPFSADEFLAAIRECYTRRAEEPEFHRLTFCLLGVATPSDLIRDVRMTPFNIGRRIELNDFTEAEAAPLAKGLEGARHTQRVPGTRRGGEGAKVLERVLYWTNGHPYLTQRLCQAVAESVGSRQ
jgi:hypothetical protein